MVSAIFLIAFCTFVFLYIIVLTLDNFTNIFFINWYIDYISMVFIILIATSGFGAMIAAIIGEL